MAENGNANFSMVLISPEWLNIQSLNFQGSMVLKKVLDMDFVNCPLMLTNLQNNLAGMVCHKD